MALGRRHPGIHSCTASRTPAVSHGLGYNPESRGSWQKVAALQGAGAASGNGSGAGCGCAEGSGG
eukprot:364233-Chlamydomonas_euryale.AAC.9